ncbi:MAG: MBL fold metallo-hydrolase [Candidatus Woykebacteria bacterium]
MKITKYPQSNFLIEDQKKRILIDPGYLTFENYPEDDFGDLEAVLITHQHKDHLDIERVKNLVGSEIPLYTNNDVASLFESSNIEIAKVKQGEEFEVAGFKIEPINIPHCKLLYCRKEGKTLAATDIVPGKKVCKSHPDLVPEEIAGPPNTGFVVNNIFFHPGDGIEIDGLKVANAAIPITGPTINYDRAWKFAESLEAKRVIPMHYSNPRFPADPNEFIKHKLAGVEVIVLKDGAPTKIS